MTHPSEFTVPTWSIFLFPYIEKTFSIDPSACTLTCSMLNPPNIHVTHPTAPVIAQINEDKNFTICSLKPKQIPTVYGKIYPLQCLWKWLVLPSLAQFCFSCICTFRSGLLAIKRTSSSDVYLDIFFTNLFSKYLEKGLLSPFYCQTDNLDLCFHRAIPLEIIRRWGRGFTDTLELLTPLTFPTVGKQQT